MLERAAGCLEQGGLRRVLNCARSPGRSRRTLHAGFWVHGAGELDLPALWTGAVGTGQHGERGFHPDRAPGSPIHVPLGAGSETPPLEFLYPVRTVAWVQQFSGTAHEISDRNLSPRTVTPRGRRTYASTAAAVSDESHASPGLLSTSAPKVSVRHERLRKTVGETRARAALSPLVSLLRHGSVDGYDEAWKLYNEGGRSEGRELLEYLRTSTRKVDAERSRQVFDALEPEHRHGREYQHAVTALLKLGYLDSADELHEEALLRRAPHPCASDLLLAQAIRLQRWDVALNTWRRYRDHVSPETPRNTLWAGVKVTSDLTERALALADHTKGLLKQAVPGHVDQLPPDVLDFTMAVLCEALYRTFTNAGAMKVPTLLEKVRSFGVEQADLYDETILRLLDRKFDDVAVQVFQDFRQLTTFRPSWELLCSILGTFCRLKDTGNIQKTMKYMDDFYSGPKKHDYGIAMDAFAARGDVDGVESLLGQYFERFGTAYLHIRFLDPLMHAYAKRGESQKAVDLFEQMSGRYGVEPDLRSWNILLEAYGKANDVDGAWQCFNNILDTDLKPNEYTYGTLIGMFANRGDVERVVDLIKLAKEHGEGTAVALYDGLVLAHINNGDVKEAEEVAEQALTMGLKGSLTRMWNYVLRACAFQRKLHEVTRVYQRMQEAGVRFDEKTYGALMQALAMAGQPDLAYKILEKLMPSNGFKPRAFHYAIVMGGYIKNREVHKVFKLFNEMVKQGIKPVMSTSVPLIKAGALTDQLGSPEHGSAGEETTLARAEKILGQVLGSTDVSEIAGEEIHKGMGKRSISEAYPSAYFEFLIFVYGQRRAFVRVKELYDQYLEKSGSRRPAGGVSPPLKMLTALMVAAYRAEDYEEVTRLWRFATEKAEEQARRWKSGGEQWVLPASRHILASPLSYHLKGLEGQGKVDEMKVTVEKMLRDGYELDNKNWNLYIQLLARGGHGVEALELCEARLMPGWKGWRDQRRRLGMKLYKVKADDRTTLRPIYHTLVWLARAVMDMKSEGLGVGERQRPLEEVLRTCPLAMEAIQNMPTEDDPVQASILGRGR